MPDGMTAPVPHLTAAGLALLRHQALKPRQHIAIRLTPNRSSTFLNHSPLLRVHAQAPSRHYCAYPPLPEQMDVSARLTVGRL
jgi:hypothetical protein